MLGRARASLRVRHEDPEFKLLYFSRGMAPITPITPRSPSAGRPARG